MTDYTEMFQILAVQAGGMAAMDNEKRVVPDEWRVYSKDWYHGYDKIKKSMGFQT